MANFDIAAHIFVNEIANRGCKTKEEFREIAKLSIEATAIFKDEFDKVEAGEDQIDSVTSILEKAMQFSEKAQKDIRDATLETLEKLLGPAPEAFKNLIKNTPDTPEIIVLLQSIKKNAEIQLGRM